MPTGTNDHQLSMVERMERALLMLAYAARKMPSAISASEEVRGIRTFDPNLGRLEILTSRMIEGS